MESFLSLPYGILIFTLLGDDSLEVNLVAGLSRGSILSDVVSGECIAASVGARPLFAEGL